jgi:hypothetical protein
MERILAPVVAIWATSTSAPGISLVALFIPM